MNLECPVCKSYMRPPIILCKSGHSICNKFRGRLQCCPCCRSDIGTSRNYTLKTVSAHLPYPYKYEDFDCRQSLPLHELTKHEKEFHKRPSPCPFKESAGCQWKDKQKTIIQHFENNHVSKVFLGNDYEAHIIFFNTNRQFAKATFFETICMIVYGNIFRASHTRDIGNRNGYWSVKLIGPKGIAKRYKFEVKIFDKDHPSKSITRSDLCQDETTEDNIFNECVYLPTDKLNINITSTIYYNLKIALMCLRWF